MKKFHIYWENCDMESGRAVITAPSRQEAETKFCLDYGIDYIIINVVELIKK